MQGPTWTCTANADHPGLEITASGGAALDELARAAKMRCHAAILGKSIYTGAHRPGAGRAPVPRTKRQGRKITRHSSAKTAACQGRKF